MGKETLIANYYDILNVKPTASLVEINEKYKKKALANHPDKNPDPDSNFKMGQLNEAKRILLDQQLRKNYDQQLFIWSLQNGNHKIISFFLKYKITNLTLNEKDNNGNTPLHYACFYNFLEIVIFLIKNGSININQKNNKDSTPLHYAIIGAASIELIKLLIDNGANIKVKDKSGYHSLQLAQEITNDKKIYTLLCTRLEQSTINENEQILLNMNHRINNLTGQISNIENAIVYFEQQKINSVLNCIIKIFTFGCVNKNKNINEQLLFKKEQLQDLSRQRTEVNNEKQLFEKKIAKLKFKQHKNINAMNIATSSTTNCKTSFTTS